jgi:hypothetical protein
VTRATVAVARRAGVQRACRVVPTRQGLRPAHAAHSAARARADARAAVELQRVYVHQQPALLLARRLDRRRARVHWRCTRGRVTQQTRQACRRDWRARLVVQVPLEEASVLASPRHSTKPWSDVCTTRRSKCTETAYRHSSAAMIIGCPCSTPRAQRVGVVGATCPLLVRVLHKDEEQRGRDAV